MILRFMEVLQDKILVRRAPAAKQTPGGLDIPDEFQEKQSEGEVLRVGPGRYLESGHFLRPRVEVGQRVLFGKYAGSDVKIGDEVLTLLREDEILGVQDGGVEREREEAVERKVEKKETKEELAERLEQEAEESAEKGRRELEKNHPDQADPRFDKPADLTIDDVDPKAGLTD